jgi:hypothetical protein
MRHIQVFNSGSLSFYDSFAIGESIALGQLTTIYWAVSLMRIEHLVTAEAAGLVTSNLVLIQAYTPVHTLTSLPSNSAVLIETTGFVLQQ